jgi:hypothetical protein
VSHELAVLSAADSNYDRDLIVLLDHFERFYSEIRKCRSHLSRTGLKSLTGGGLSWPRSVIDKAIRDQHGYSFRVSGLEDGLVEILGYVCWSGCHVTPPQWRPFVV